MLELRFRDNNVKCAQKIIIDNSISAFRPTDIDNYMISATTLLGEEWRKGGVMRHTHQFVYCFAID